MRSLVCLALAFSVVGLVACGSSSSSGPAPAPAASQRGAAMAQDAAAPLPPTQKTDYAENEFTESDRARDPFRSFAATMVDDKGKKSRGPEVPVVLGQYSIDELKLIGISTGGDFPRAMVTDPTSKGWVLKKGDYIGRPEVVHVGGANGADYQLNWRVDRIRDGDIVLTREDPAQPSAPPATRVIPLHPEAENTPTGTN
jgi:type IV pilus assembly protein PilP